MKHPRSFGKNNDVQTPRHRGVKRCWTAALFLALRLTAGSVAEPFRDGDRVCFIGDSITHQMLYHTEITLFYLTRFPNWRVETVNCGFAGDTAAGAVRRYDWDIAARKPTVATVMLGMNDVNRGLYKPGSTGPDTEAKRAAALDSHIKNMEILAERLHRDGVRLIFMGPSPYDQTGSQSEENLFGVNDALKFCGAAAHKLAEKVQAGWVDFNAPMDAINRAWQAKQPAFTLVGPDRIHPGPAGHLVMAYLFLKAQHAPAVVAEATLDGRQGKVVRQNNCDISDVRMVDGGLTFTCRSGALPFPVDKACGPALEWVPFMQELNREMLTVTGLSGDRYALEIDGALVVKTTAAALAKGIAASTVGRADEDYPRKRRAPAPALRDTPGGLTTSSGRLVQNPADRVRQLIEAARLAEEVDILFQDAAMRDHVCGIPGEIEAAQRGVLRAQTIRQLAPVHAGHDHIRDKQVDRLRLFRGQA